MRHLRALALGLLHVLAAVSGCSSPDPNASSDSGSSGVGGGPSSSDPFDVPIDGATHAQAIEFSAGDVLFDLPLREPDGLGPLYTRSSCSACHRDGARGPGFVQKMSVVDADGVTASSDQSKLPFGNTVHPLTAAGAITPILPPDDPSIKVTKRVGPPVLGRGYLEAIDDAEIERVASEQSTRSDSIHGRVNHVIYQSETSADPDYHQHKKGDSVIGRFGLKARIATLDDFTADAMQGDMGITSPLRLVEIANPDGLTDDMKPGVDVTLESVSKRANYMRLIAIPRRPSFDEAGANLFAQVKCAVCHVPTMRTRADYPLAPIAGIDAPVFTDILLHDMGDALADGTAGIDGEATSRDWRTAPLIGLRFNRAFLHDGRSTELRDAILQHDSPGSEASESVKLFLALPAAQQTLLLELVSSL